MSIAALTIVVEAIDNASKTFKGIAKQVENLESVADAASKAGETLQGVGRGLTASVTAPIAAGLGLAAKTAIDFEASVAGAAKTIGTTGAETQELSNDILKLSRHLPMAASGLADIAAFGGQLGIARQDIAGFVELAGTMGTAFDMSADAAGEAVAKLNNVYSLNLQQAESTGDVINAISNTSAASAAQIITAMNQAGGSLRQFGFTAAQSAALTGSGIAFGRAPESVATALAGMLPLMQTATRQAPKFQEGLERAGLSATQLENAIAQDAMGGLTMFIDTLGELDGRTQASVITDMFGAGSDSQLIAQLAADSSGLAQNLELIGDSANYAGSMQAEFEAQAGTTANQLQLARNAAMEASISLGNALTPAITDVLNAITPLIQKFAEFAQNNPGITQIGVAIAGVAAAVGPVLIAVGAVVSALGAVLPVIGGMAAAFASVAAGPILIGLAAISGFAALIAMNWQKVTPAIQRVWASVQNLIAAFAPLAPAIQLAGSAFIKVASVAANALGRVIVGVINVSSKVVAAFINMQARILSTLANIASQAFSAGRRIVEMIAQGILSGISAAVNAGKAVARAVMSVLPQSPVDVGPLRALNNPATSPGAKIVDMLAAGMRSQSGMLQSTMGGMMRPAASPAGMFATPRPATTNGPITINAPLNVTANGGDPESIKAALREHRDEIFQMISEYSQQGARLNYG